MTDAFLTKKMSFSNNCDKNASNFNSRFPIVKHSRSISFTHDDVVSSAVVRYDHQYYHENLHY